MNRYHEGAWATLPTTFLGVNNGVASYTAQSPGFSLFAITSKKNGAQAGDRIGIESCDSTIFLPGMSRSRCQFPVGVF